MKIKVTMTVEISDDDLYFVDVENCCTEDNVAQYIENEIHDSLGIRVIECDGKEIYD